MSQSPEDYKSYIFRVHFSPSHLFLSQNSFSLLVGRECFWQSRTLEKGFQRWEDKERFWFYCDNPCQVCPDLVVSVSYRSKHVKVWTNPPFTIWKNMSTSWQLISEINTISPLRITALTHGYQDKPLTHGYQEHPIWSPQLSDLTKQVQQSLRCPLLLPRSWRSCFNSPEGIFLPFAKIRVFYKSQHWVTSTDLPNGSCGHEGIAQRRGPR